MAKWIVSTKIFLQEKGDIGKPYEKWIGTAYEVTFLLDAADFFEAYNSALSVAHEQGQAVISKHYFRWRNFHVVIQEIRAMETLVI